MFEVFFLENQIMRKNCTSWREWGNTSVVCTAYA